MKKRSLSKDLLIWFFMAFLCLPHVLWVFVPKDVRETLSENRTLASFPALTMEQIRSWPSSFENWYNDHLPFRAPLVFFNNCIDFFVFRKSSNDDVLLGKDGWLFYNSESDGDPVAHYTGSYPLDERKMEKIADDWSLFRDHLAAEGIEFMIFIAPNKERIYHDYMPDYLGKPTQNPPVEKLIKYIQENTDLQVVYPYDELMEARSACAYPLYYSTDTHWNNIGAYIGSRQLLAQLDIEIPPLTNEDVVAYGQRSGDLASMLNLAYVLSNDNDYLIDGFASEPSVTSGTDSRDTADFSTSGIDARRFFMIRDSFGLAMCPYIASQFNNARFTHYQSFDYQTMLDYKPDVVVLQLVERYLDSRYLCHFLY